MDRYEGRSSCAVLVVATFATVGTSCTFRERPATPPANFDRDALVDHAQQAARDGAIEDARRSYAALLSRNEHDDEARAGLARLHAWEGDYERAEGMYRDVLARHPTDDDVRAGLFDVLVWDQRWTDAARLLDAAPRPPQAPETPVLLGLRARLVYANGDVTTARKLAEQAERLAQNDVALRELRRRLFTRSARITPRLIASAHGAPSLGQIDVGLSQSVHRFRLTFDTEQGGRPTSVTSGWACGATYGAGAWWTFAPGLTWGADFALGAPAAMVPVVRVRSQFTAPWRPWLSSSLGLSFRRFADDIDTFGMSPSMGLTLRGEVRLDATYWLTFVKMRGRDEAESSRWVQAVGLSAGRTIFPWLDLRAGYAHGAEAERLPLAFQLLDLVNDSFYMGIRIWPAGFVSIEPLYGIALRGPQGGTRQVQHTFELGFVVRQ